MNKRMKKGFWENIERYGFILEISCEMIFQIDLQEGICQVASFGAGVFDSFPKEEDYQEAFDRMFRQIDVRDRDVFAKCSLDNLRSFANKKDNQKLMLPYRYQSDKEIWMENIVMREASHDNILLMLVREISNDVIWEREVRNRAELVDNLVQDIQIPLYTVIGLNEICNKHTDNPMKVKEYLEKQKIAIEHLKSVVNDIAGMRDNQSGKIQMKEKNFNLSEVMKDIVMILQQRCEKRGIDFKVSFKNLLHEELFGDDMKISRILMNIIANVIKYAKFQDDILFLVREHQLGEEDFAEYEFCIFNNYDTFLALYEENKDNTELLAQKWTKENESEPEFVAIREMVRALGGKIYYNIEPGVGSMAIVTMKIQINREKQAMIEVPDCSGKRVLVADDDQHVLQWMEEMLTAQGMKVVLAKGSREAVNIAYDAIKENLGFDMVIISWKMKELDGLETTRLLRKILGFKTSVIMQSAYDWSDIEFEARDIGVNYFAIKPLTLSSILPILEKMNDSVEQMEEIEQIPDFTGKHVLLVESDRNYCEIIEECLTDVSMTFEVAKSGRQAVEIMMVAEENEFDLILLETEMPLMNGYDTARMIRKLPGEYIRRIPMIAIVSGNDTDNISSLLRAGLNGQIKKPIELRDLYETLRCYLS